MAFAVHKNTILSTYVWHSRCIRTPFVTALERPPHSIIYMSPFRQLFITATPSSHRHDSTKATTRFILALMLCSVVSLSARAQQTTAAWREDVRTAVRQMTTQHPQATLQDIYKSFYQDRFGPGHMLADTAAAAAYYDRELSQVTDIMRQEPDTMQRGECGGRPQGPYRDSALYELTGARGRYVRIHLAAVVLGVVSRETLFAAFVRSTRPTSQEEQRRWAREWQEVEKVVRAMDLDLQHYDEDRRTLRRLSRCGASAVHHSAAYNQLYAPHYRIVSREIFDRELRPLLH